MVFNMCCYLITRAQFYLTGPTFNLFSLFVLFRFCALLIIPSRPSAFIACGLICRLDSWAAHFSGSRCGPSSSPRRRASSSFCPSCPKSGLHFPADAAASGQ